MKTLASFWFQCGSIGWRKDRALQVAAAAISRMAYLANYIPTTSRCVCPLRYGRNPLGELVGNYSCEPRLPTCSYLQFRVGN